MLRRWVVIVPLLIVGVILVWAWWSSRLPPGVVTQSGADASVWNEWIQLIAGLVGILGGIIGLVDRARDAIRGTRRA